MLDIEDFNKKFYDVVTSESWKQLEDAFREATSVLIFGNGGNLAIADHAAIDISRLTDKSGIAPGSGITATSIIGDKDASCWLETWLSYRLRGLDPSKCLAIGLSCSTTGTSSGALVGALKYAADNGVKGALISAQPKDGLDERIIAISQNVSLYHTSEILSLALTYQLTHSAGFECPSVFKKARDRKFEKLGIESEQGNKTSRLEVPPGFERELNNLAIDFDGVIHTFDKGWWDGTCYGDPISGSVEAIRELSREWNLIVYSAKARPDRPLVGGKTGKQLIEEWLDKHDLLDLVDEVTHEKPRAKYYIDDKAIEFKNNWADILERLKA
jgi:hypothetical protein